FFDLEEEAPELEAEQIPEEEFAEGEAKEQEEARSQDLVMLYLREAGSVPLLSPERERQLAQQMEAGKAQVHEAVFSFPFTVSRVLDLANKAAEDEVPLRDLLGELEEEEAEPPARA